MYVYLSNETESSKSTNIKMNKNYRQLKYILDEKLQQN